jgi:polysaccharide deacetylase family protein (PEP-CTERM system associated)
MPSARTYLFSVDVEDPRLMIPNGERFRPRVEQMTGRFLDWLDRHQFSATFFVVGDVARRHPDLVREIARRGHEIGCHSNRHIPLDQQSPDEFRADVSECLEALAGCGAGAVIGYRAPTCSLTEQTSWAYDALAALGIQYSSSVLPAPNPLYGWPEFGAATRRMPSGVLEIPMTIGRFGPLQVPVGGGVYFRVLPFSLIARAIARSGSAGPRSNGRGAPDDVVTGYFHPYDIDVDQERFMHAGIKNNRFYHWLMFLGRGKVLDRLDRLVENGLRVETYGRYAARFAA